MSEKFCSIFTFVECKNINRILLTPNSKIPCIHLYSVFKVILPVQLWWIDSYFINYYFFSLTEWVVLKSKRASLNFQSIIHNNQRFFKLSFSYSCPHYSPCCSPLPCPTSAPKDNPYPTVLDHGFLASTLVFLKLHALVWRNLGWRGFLHDLWILFSPSQGADIHREQ